MPAAAVIPAPIAYIKVVAVKKLVVGFLAWCEPGPRLLYRRCDWRAGLILLESAIWLLTELVAWIRIIYFEKIRVFKAGYSA